MRFDPADGNKPTQSTVKTGTLAFPPEKNPVRDGFRFDGWTLDGQPFDFQAPILQDTTLKAQWTKTTDWTLSPDHGPASGARLTISPPNRLEPYYASIQSAGEQFVGLTGDGRIYTWTQDRTPEQVPFPAQATDGFHYLQAAAGSRRQAALGSDQKIYTWTSGQSTPTLLDTSQDAEFTSISMNGDRLLAVDRQGQVHNFQASQADSQNQNLKFLEQAATSLPGQAQAVLAVASADRILTLDSDGHAWTWGATNTEKAKPTGINLDAGIHIIQATALSQGVLLLDEDGQAYYLADRNPDITAVSLPESMKANRIAGNDSQAIITDTDGHVWAWKPGETPMRTDKGSQHYMQAIGIGDSITGIGRQGSIFTWTLDKQGQPGKPARITTIQAPTLESASMDSHALTLSKKDDSWQADIPAHKPGPAIITIIGKHYGQPFTKSLNYMVERPLTRDAEQGPTYEVRFNTAKGSEAPDQQQVSYPYGRVQRPSPNPVREGYQFDGWFIGEVAYDFSKPVTEDLTLTAHWTPNKQNSQWRIDPNKGSQLGNETTTISPPGIRSGIKFSQVSSSIGPATSDNFSLAVGSDGNAYAWGLNKSGQLGDGTETDKNKPVMVKMPDRTTYPDLPEDFTYVQVSAGDQYSLALGSDGYVYAWGLNNVGQLGNGTTSGRYDKNPVPTRVRDPASPSDTSKGLKAIQVSAGRWHSLAVDTDGNAWAWGSNSSGVLGNEDSNSYSPVLVQFPKDADTESAIQISQVSAGLYHSLAVDSKGYVWAWGINTNGQLGNGTTSGRYDKNPVPTRVRDPASPSDTSKGLKAIQVSAGGWHSLAVDKNGKTWAWGQNNRGQLGNKNIPQGDFNKKAMSSIPVPAQYPTTEGVITAVQVSAGVQHSLAIDKSGNAWAWGDNTYGELGDSTMADRYPVKVVASTQSSNLTGPWLKVAQVSGGDTYSLAIDTNGDAKAWGINRYGELGNGTTSGTKANPVPVPVVFNLAPVITGVRFDSDVGTNLTRGDGSSVIVLTPAHQPGTVTVSVDYTLGGAPQTPDTSLRYTYLPAGVLPKAGGEGILLALATGMTGMGGILASRRHRKEQHQLSHASHE